MFLKIENRNASKWILSFFPCPFHLAYGYFLCGHRSGHYVWEDHRPRSGVWKGTSGGEVISFSGCDDHQISIDTRVSNINSNILILISFNST